MRLPWQKKKKRSGRANTGMSLFKAGLIGIVVVVVFSYLASTKFHVPFLTSKYTAQVVFRSANGLRPGSLVRIAGINVGQVKSVEPVSKDLVGSSERQQADCAQGNNAPAGCQAALVTMQLQDLGLPLHTDATFNIRPRIFLEGNFFIDVHPGTPEAPIAPDGHTFPLGQGTEPVQFDQILSALPADTRQNLQILLEKYGYGVKHGGPSYNQSINYWLPAYKYSSIVGHDFLGYKTHDLSGWIDQGGTVAAALDAHPQNLKSLITDFNSTAHAFAVQNLALQNAVSELPNTLNTGDNAFNALNTAFPPLRQLARALVPGVVSSGPTIDASLPFIRQLRLLVQPSELRGLAADLAVSIPALARLSQATIPLMKNGVRPASSCVTNVIHPWSEMTVPDSHFNASNGFPPRKAYVEAVDFLPGLSGESRTLDANGPYVRVGLTGGSLTYSLAPNTFGQAVAPLSGTQPAKPPGGLRPPLHPRTPCETQPPITNLTAPETSIGPIAAGNGSVVSSLGQQLGLPLNLSHDKAAAQIAAGDRAAAADWKRLLAQTGGVKR